MADDGGVLGNLPRSRPGRRSDKRAQGGQAAAGKTAGRSAESAATAAERAERAEAPAAKPARGARSAGSARVKPAAGPRRAAGAAAGEAPRMPPERHSDPLGQAVRTATGVAGTGVRLAGTVARELLRRLPRP